MTPLQAIVIILLSNRDLPENPDPHNNEKKKSQLQPQRNDENKFFEDDFDIDLDEVSKIEITVPKPNQNHRHATNDGFEEWQDLEFNDFESDRATINNASTKNNFSNTSIRRSTSKESLVVDDDMYLPNDDVDYDRLGNYLRCFVNEKLINRN